MTLLLQLLIYGMSEASQGYAFLCLPGTSHQVQDLAKRQYFRFSNAEGSFRCIGVVAHSVSISCVVSGPSF